MDRSERVFEAQLAEHISARDELLSAINNQHTTLTFGSAALVAVFGAGFISWEQAIAPALFFALVPLSWWILTMWLGEVVRMLRAVEFCGDQEQILNQSLAPQPTDQAAPLRWESWRRKADAPWRTVTSTYISVAVLLLFTNAAAMGCGTVTAIANDWATEIIVLIWLFAVAGGIGFARWVLVTFQIWSAAGVGMPFSPFVRAFERLPLGRKRQYPTGD